MRAPKGMLDVLPPESARWTELVAALRGVRRARFGYGLLVTPIVEHYEVFQRRRRDHRCRTQGDVRLCRYAAAGGSRCGPKVPRPSCARSCSIVRRRRGRCGTFTPNCTPSSRRRAGIANTGKSESRLSASTIPTSTSRSSSCSTGSTATSDCATCGCCSIRWATPRPEALSSTCCWSTGTRTRSCSGGEMERAELNPLRILDFEAWPTGRTCSNGLRNSASI